MSNSSIVKLSLVSQSFEQPTGLVFCNSFCFMSPGSLTVLSVVVLFVCWIDLLMFPIFLVLYVHACCSIILTQRDEPGKIKSCLDD